jgi:predicted pyridoxine 5'-phosphate oxidase superfamily flavin-nucleotide-binding protein
MPVIPESVKKAWDNRDGAIVFTTVDKDGMPNSIYATCAVVFGDDKIVVANNYFDKTMKNIEAGSSASILFITSEKKSYQMKGALEYFSDGEIFDDMKKWNPEKHPGHGAAVVLVGSIYSGAEKIL